MGATVQIPQCTGPGRQALPAQKQWSYTKENFEIQNTVEVGNGNRSDCASIFNNAHINHVKNIADGFSYDEHPSAMYISLIVSIGLAASNSNWGQSAEKPDRQTGKKRECLRWDLGL